MAEVKPGNKPEADPDSKSSIGKTEGPPSASGEEGGPDSMRTMLGRLNEQIGKMAQSFEKTQIADYVQLLNRPRRLILTNMLAGIARGVGIAIGFTIFTATIVYFLQKVGALNLPIIGDYVADIVQIVQAQLEGRTY